ncbi:MAG: hypothetical protein AAGF28_00915 [Pseudomonadota bacterium]
MKIILVSLLTSVAAASGLYGSSLLQNKDSRQHAVAAAAEPTLRYSQPMLLVAPVIYDTELSGYLIANLVLAVDHSVLKTVRQPLDLITGDAFLDVIVGNDTFALPRIPNVDIDALKDGLKNRINTALGANLVHDVFGTQVNFMGKSEVRTKQSLRSVALSDKIPAE